MFFPFLSVSFVVGATVTAASSPRWTGDNESALLIFLFCFALQNKEVAVEIEKLADGTVIFEDITTEKVIGRVLKTLKTQNGRRPSDPLGGRIFYEK